MSGSKLPKANAYAVIHCLSPFEKYNPALRRRQGDVHGRRVEHDYQARQAEDRRPLGRFWSILS